MRTLALAAIATSLSIVGCTQAAIKATDDALTLTATPKIQTACDFYQEWYDNTVEVYVNGNPAQGIEGDGQIDFIEVAFLQGMADGAEAEGCSITELEGAAR